MSNEISPYASCSSMLTRTFQAGEVSMDITFRSLWTLNEEVIYKQSEMAIKNQSRLEVLASESANPDAARATIQAIRNM